MRFSEGSIAARSAAYLVCSLSVSRKFREGLYPAFRTPIVVRKKTWLRCRAQPGLRRLDLLLDDPDFDLGMHIRVQSDRYAVDSQRPDRLVQLDLPFFDLESLGVELMRDV